MSEFAPQRLLGGLGEWLVDIENQLRRMGPLPTTEMNEIRRRAFKLPPTIRNQRPEYDDFYRPQRVSFGPYNHGDVQCKAGERVKQASLVHFLRRSSQQDLQIYIDGILPVLDMLQECYDLPDGRRDDVDSFLRIMLLDGCFILELIRTTNIDADDSSDNPAISRILDSPGEINCYLHDMLLIENQLPMLLLEKLYIIHTGAGHPREDILNKLVMDIATTFIHRWNLPRKRDLYRDEPPMHVLDVVRMGLVNHESRRVKVKPQNRPIKISNIINIPSATELHKVGIGVTTSNTKSLTDIRFHRNTLMLPPVVVDGSTRSLLLNLLALEQAGHRNLRGKHVTAYVFLMGGLVQGADDASLLQSRGVLITALPGVDLAKVFSGVSKGISDLDPEFNPCFFVMEKLRARFNRMSNEWRKDLFQTYLKSPWAVMSVVAGLLLFVLSTIQTVYTVLSYVHPK